MNILLITICTVFISVLLFVWLPAITAKSSDPSGIASSWSVIYMWIFIAISLISSLFTLPFYFYKASKNLYFILIIVNILLVVLSYMFSGKDSVLTIILSIVPLIFACICCFFAFDKKPWAIFSILIPILIFMVYPFISTSISSMSSKISKNTLKEIIETNNLEKYKKLVENKETLELYLQEMLIVGDKKTYEFLVSAGEINNYHLLNYAIRRNDKEMIDFLISKGADINAEDKDGQPPLYKAVEKDNKEIVELLINQGANVNVKYEENNTPLHYAVKNKNKEIVKMLIDAGAEIEVKDKNNDTPLDIALRYMGEKRRESFLLGEKKDKSTEDNKYEDIANYLISKGAKIQGKNYSEILKKAIKEGNEERVKFCISKGAEVNPDKRTYSEDTPLRFAVENGNKKIVEMLINAGADVNAQGAEEETPLYVACREGNKEIATLLIDKGADANLKSRHDYTPLLSAITGENADRNFIEFLISKGADVNLDDDDGRTPLMSAVIHKNKDIAELLIAKGADVNSEEEDGSTALTYATRFGQKDILDLLLSKGAKVKDIFVAASMGDLDTIKKIFSRGNIKINGLDKESGAQRTLLEYAATNGQIEVAKFLIDNGADVNFITGEEYWGRTALSYAAEAGQKEMVEFLISKGAKVDFYTKSGWTPLLYAISEGHKDIVEILIQKGANLNATTSEHHRTALNLAADYGYNEIVDLLISKGVKVEDSFMAAAAGDLNLLSSDNMNSSNLYGMKPLHYAVLNNRIKAAEYLLNKNANNNDKDNSGKTPLDYAKTDEMKQLLISHGAKSGKDLK